jgi:hypothetical protein
MDGWMTQQVVHMVTTVLDSVNAHPKAHWNVSVHWGETSICIISQNVYVFHERRKLRGGVGWGGVGWGGVGWGGVGVGLRWIGLPLQAELSVRKHQCVFLCGTFNRFGSWHALFSGKHNMLLAFAFSAPARLGWRFSWRVVISVYCHFTTRYEGLNMAALKYLHLKCLSQSFK